MPVCKIRSIVCSCRNFLPCAKQRNSFLRFDSNREETRKKSKNNAEHLYQTIPALNKDLDAVLYLIRQKETCLHRYISTTHKLKLFLPLVKLHAMKAYGKVEVLLQSFLTGHYVPEEISPVTH
jgi:hypothetical protein